MIARFFQFLSIVFIFTTLNGTAQADTKPPFDVAAREALLVDLSTNTILYEKSADTPMPPASMSKLMTVDIIFEALATGELSLDDTYHVSEKAWRMGGSKMFVSLKSKVTISDLLRGVIVQSGNDACVVLAEGYAGSEEYFAQLMNERAQDIGLTHSTFKNATGWPDPEHRMSARDLALLAKHIIETYPQYYSIFAEPYFTYGTSLDGNPMAPQPNRNPILGRVKGADGLKTGHTEAAGYGLTASAEREGRRLVLVLNGLSSKRHRAQLSGRLIEWGFRNFGSYSLLQAGQVVEEAPVWLGVQARVPLVVEKDLTVTLTKRDRVKMKATVEYSSPIKAAIKKGAPIARLVLRAPDMGERVIPLVAGADVDKVGAFGKLGSAVQFLILGQSGGE